MTDLERRALLGDRQAQEECTRKGIVLTCPFCGGKAVLRSSVSQYGGSYNIRCENRCVVTKYTEPDFFCGDYEPKDGEEDAEG